MLSQVHRDVVSFSLGFFAVLAAVGFLLSSVVADFGCTSESKNSTNGTWEAHYSGCSQEPRENTTIVLNVTNVTQQDTILDEAVMNITILIRSQEEFNLVNTSLELCRRDLDRLGNLDLEAQGLRENTTICSTNLDSTTASLKAVSEERDYSNSLRGLLGFGGFVGGIATYYFFKGRKQTSMQGVAGTTGRGGEPTKYDKEKVEKDLQMEELRSKIGYLESSLGKKRR